MPKSAPGRTAAAAVLLAVIVLPAAAPRLAAEPIGEVVRIQASAFAMRSGARVNLAAGSPVELDDELRTGRGARLLARLVDGTEFTLGADAALTVDQYVFDTDRGAGTAVIRSLEGAFRFVTGRLGELRESRIEVATPVAVIAVRGTDFWGGPIRGAYGVLLLDGAVAVTNPAGERLLAEPGQGVDIEAADTPPGEIRQWPQDKRDEAIATVSFTQ